MVVQTTCSAPDPSSKSLQALVKLLGLKGVKISESKEPSCVVTSQNALTGLTSSTSSTSWLGCARSLCSQVPLCGLWGDGSPKQTALVEAWIETASSTIVPVIQGAKSDPAFTAAVEGFAEKLESHLFEQDQTYLVGDIATAADVCVALWLAHACAKCSIAKLPQQTFRWCMTLCHHDVLSEFAPKSLPTEGTTSPSQKKKLAAPAAAAAESSFANNPIVQKLVEWKIPHQVYAHKLSKTADELVANVPIPDGDTHTKNLFFKDKKHGLFLVTVCTDHGIDTKALGKALDLQGKVNLRLADEKALDEFLKVKPGCVGPLCVVNRNPTAEPKITVVLDSALLEKQHVHSHPLVNDASVILTPKALQDYINKTGHEPVYLEFGPSVRGGAAANVHHRPTPPVLADKNEKAAAAPKKPQQQHQQKKTKDTSNKKTNKKGSTLLKLQWKKEENFPMWYSDVIVLSEMISYYDISGCYILRPWSYKIWELVQEWFNKEIEMLDVENSYFPMFVSKDRLEKEKDHVEGFSPEVAWVTKSGDGDLAKPIAVRPTSETVMYPAFSDWIKSHRDLPLKLNQWCNVVRWEFKDPTPFLRTREFLWQEGHTAHATLEDANVMVLQALDLYKRVYEELMAVPVVPGYKTEKEKFAGGYQTTTVEAYISGSGRAIQGATSHNLGQNFGKMFDISFQDKDGKTQIPWQTSWGLTTRTLGVMIMVHGDDTGLVLPPRVAPLQVVIVPVLSKHLTSEKANPYCESILKDLQSNNVRAKYDDRASYNPGWKYNHWEQKGVPIRVEVGPRDMENKSARVAIRFNGEKEDLPVDGLGAALKSKLEKIHNAMFDKAKAARDTHLVQVTEWKDFVPNLELHNLVLTPWCGGEHKDWEEWVKDKSKEESLKSRGEEGEDERAATSVAAKTLCIPFDQPELPEGTKCIASGMPATCWVLWGRSY